MDTRELRDRLARRRDDVIDYVRTPRGQRMLTWVAAGAFVLAVLILGVWMTGRVGPRALGIGGGTRDYARTLAEALAADPRWGGLEVARDRDSAGRVVVRVRGALPAQADFEVLRGFVEATSPPAPIAWEIDLPPPDPAEEDPP
jgi:hypothetical protein